MWFREPKATSKLVYLAAFLLVIVAGCGPEARRAAKLTANATTINLIQDPSFEDGPPRELNGFSRPWVGEEASQVFIANDDPAHQGTQYAKMIGSTGQLMQMVGLSLNTGYRVSAFVSGTPGIDQHATQPDWIRGFFVAPRGGPDAEDPPDGDDGFDGPPYLKAVPITTGSGDWQELAFTFNSGPYSEVSVNFDVRFFSDEILKVDDVSVTQEPQAPPAHPSLSGSSGDGRVDLSWSDYPGATSYGIWRADTAVEFPRLIARVNGQPPPTIFNDRDVINGREYSYQVAVEDGTEVWIFSYERLLFTPSSM
jgi:hypothetical protein